ncbi:MAG: hypothetical protein IPK19_22950 [Chloroflexi bacterium]|nr:hypothetical protein [Chloroflexota bacterium]
MPSATHRHTLRPASRSISRTAFGLLSDFMASNPSPEAIVAYRLPEDIQIRSRTLLDQMWDTPLTPQEHEELVDFARAVQTLSLLKTRMRARLASAGG